MRIIGAYRIYTFRSRRGMVLITAMWIVIALTAVVLVLCREMVVESLTTRQHLSQARADAAEIGAEQFVLSIVEQELIQPGYKDTTQWEQRKIGDCYFWVLTYNVDDETQFSYGLTDEASKIDLNTATVDMLEMLPGMTNYPNLGAEIVDWRDPDDLVTISDSGGQGEESNDYESTLGYSAKNAPFESVDELKLLDGTDALFLHGADTNHNHTLDPVEAANADPSLQFETASELGVEPFVTVYGAKATNMDTTSMLTTTSQIYSPISQLNLTDTNGNPVIIPVDINSATTANATVSQLITTVLTAAGVAQAQSSAITTAIRTRLAVTTGGTNSEFMSLFDLAAATTPPLTSQQLTQIYPYLMTMPTAPAANSTASALTEIGKLNIMTASKAALMCLPGFTEDDADNIITYREQNDPPTDANGNTQISNIGWLIDQVDPTILKQAQPYITGSSTIFSADIVTVSQDGRAFKRVKIVVDASTGTPQIVYRRDLTAAGWPLDPSIRDSLRKGEALAAPGSTDGSTPGGRLSMGVH